MDKLHQILCRVSEQINLMFRARYQFSIPLKGTCYAFWGFPCLILCYIVVHVKE